VADRAHATSSRTASMQLQRHANRDANRHEHVHLPYVEQVAGDVIVSDHGEELREGVHHEARKLRQVLLLDEGLVAKSPAPRHENARAFVAQVHADEKPEPREHEGCGDGCDGDGDGRRRGFAAAPDCAGFVVNTSRLALAEPKPKPRVSRKPSVWCTIASISLDCTLAGSVPKTVPRRYWSTIWILMRPPTGGKRATRWRRSPE
jgi:hypothetical protein